MIETLSKLDRIRQMLSQCHDESAGTSYAANFEQILALVDDVKNKLLHQPEAVRHAEEQIRVRLEGAYHDRLKSESIFRTIFENAPIGMAQLDANLKFMAVNPAMQNMLGYTETELLEMTALDVSHPDERPPTSRILPDILKNGGLTAYEKRLCHKSGRIIWVRISSRVVELEPGRGPSLIAAVRDITDLRVSELQNTMILNTMSDGMVLQDASGTITTFNPAACEILGLTPEQLCGRTSLDPRWRVTAEDGSFIPGDDHPAMVALRTGRKVTGVLVGMELPGGERRWLRVNSTPFSARGELSVGEEVHHVVTTFANVTDLIRTKKEFEAQNQLLNSVLDNLPILVFAKNAADNFKFTLFNKHGEDLLGLKETDIIDRTVYDLFPKEQADFFEQKDRDVFKLGRKILIERAQMLSAKGQRWMKTYKVPTYRANDEPDLLVGISVDITDEIEAEEKRKRLLDENRAILKSARFAIITTDLNGLITSFNDEAERVLGYSADEIIGECTLAAFHDRIELDRVAQQILNEFSQTVPVGFQAIAFRAARGEADERHWTYIRKDGQRVPVRLSMTALRNTENRVYGFLGIAKDLTAELALQRTLESERAKSLHSAKMASLGEMSAGIAHEINNPLAILSGNLRLLRDFRHDDIKFESRSAAMIKAAARIEKIVKGLQKFSRSSENRDYRVEDLSEILAEAMVMAEVRAKRFATPVGVEVAGRPRIFCDAVEIEQVLINLINNGVDAVKSLEEKWVKVRAFTQDGQVVIQVIDAGRGVPADIERKIFQPFFTTKPIGEGTGLGLSIARGIVEQHGATIALNRSIDHTCFELRFPMAEGIVNGV